VVQTGSCEGSIGRVLCGGNGIPEFDAAVCGSATTGKKAALVRAPGDGFDSGFVAAFLFTPAVLPPLIHFIPDEDLIVVASGCQLLCLLIPFQTAHLLFVSSQAAKVLVRLANVAMQNCAIARAG